MKQSFWYSIKQDNKGNIKISYSIFNRIISIVSLILIITIILYDLFSSLSITNKINITATHIISSVLAFIFLLMSLLIDEYIFNIHDKTFIKKIGILPLINTQKTSFENIEEFRIEDIDKKTITDYFRGNKSSHKVYSISLILNNGVIFYIGVYKEAKLYLIKKLNEYISL